MSQDTSAMNTVRDSDPKNRVRRDVALGLAAALAAAAPWREATGQVIAAASNDAGAAPNFPIPMRADHVMLGVDDMDGMITWYREKLSFQVERAWTVDGLPGIQLAYIGAHGFRLELIAGGRGPRTPDPASFDQHFRMRGFQHLCLWTENVDAVMAELSRRGVQTFYPATDFPNGAERRVAFVKDPEGNVIEFAGPLTKRA